MLVMLVIAAAVVSAVKRVTRDSSSSSTVQQPAAIATTGGPGQHSFLATRGAGAVLRRAAAPLAPSSVTKLEQRMSIERKVAQLFLVGFSGTGTGAPVFGDLAQLDLGGLVFQSGNYTGPQQLAGLTAFATQVSRRHGHVPPWLLTIQDGGKFSALRGLPPADSPGDLASVTQARSEATRPPRSLHALGINGVLGPDLDVDTDSGGPYTDVAYSSDPNEVGAFGVATVRAFERQKMLTVVKHFPGLGAATQSTDDGAAKVGLPLDALATRDLVPFKAALDAGSRACCSAMGSTRATSSPRPRRSRARWPPTCSATTSASTG